jgi:serine/threonine-protein kinase
VEVKPFRLGDWLVEPALDRLTRNGTVVHLRPQAMDVLAFLASRAGAVVSHDETMAAVWGERFVNEYALTRCIADLRKALGEDARHTQYIENIPKRGYRVIAPVVPAADGPQPPDTPAGGPPSCPTPPGGEAGPTGTESAPRGRRQSEEASRPAHESGTMGRRARHAAAMGALGLLALGTALGVLAISPRPDVEHPVTVARLTVAPAAALATTTRGTPGGSRTALALLPDGRTLVFVGTSGDTTALYVRRLERDAAERLADTEGAQAPAVSPDGRTIAFWSRGEIRTMPLEGGAATRVHVVGAVPPFGLAWLDGGHLVYALETGGLWRVPVGGGRAVALTTPRSGEVSHRLPHALPGGQAVVFTVRHSALAWGRESIAVQRLAGGDPATLVERGTDARYVPTGHLVFMDLGALTAVPFDAATLAVTGPPVVLLEHVAQALNEAAPAEDGGGGQFAVSARGDLVYVRREGGVAPSARLVLAWVDARGRVELLPVEPRHYVQPRLSPDGTRIATIVRDLASVDLWLYDLRRSAWTALTEDADVQGAAWSPDGRELVVATPGDVVVRAARAASPGRPIARLDGRAARPSSWSRAGQVAVLTGRDSAHLRIACLGTEATPPGGARGTVPVLLGAPDPPVARRRRGATERFAEFSPDGRWLAFASDESGRDEVYVRSAGSGDTTAVQVSDGGGSHPLWRREGLTLYYASRPAHAPGALLRAVPLVVDGATLRAGPPRTVTALPDADLGSDVNGWDVSLDGTRFLMALAAQDRVPVLTTHVEYLLDFGGVLRARVRPRE